FFASEYPGRLFDTVYFLVRRLNGEMRVVVMNVRVCSASVKYFLGTISCKGRLRKNFTFKLWTSISMGSVDVFGVSCSVDGLSFGCSLFMSWMEIRIVMRLRMRMRMRMRMWVRMMVVGRKLEDTNL